jgi:hypothetical protein
LDTEEDDDEEDGEREEDMDGDDDDDDDDGGEDDEDGREDAPLLPIFSAAHLGKSLYLQRQYSYLLT